MKDLTKAEEQVMMFLWERGEAFVKELLEDFPEPKPAYNTVSTIVRILESKGFVGYTAKGKSHRYHPLIQKEEYMKHAVGGLLQNYFNGSLSGFVSFFSRQGKLKANELDELLKLIEEQKKKA